jgi:outer membrane protein assembly factor BamB
MPATGVNGASVWTQAFLEFSPDGTKAFLGWAPILRSGQDAKSAVSGQVVAISMADGSVLWRRDGSQDNATAGSLEVPGGAALVSDGDSSGGDGSVLVVEVGSGDHSQPTEGGTVAFQGLSTDDGSLLWVTHF